MITKALLYIGMPLALLIGWQAHSWYADSQALSQYEQALTEAQKAFQNALDDYAAEVEAEAQRSIALEQQNAKLRETVGALQEEISHAFTTPTDSDSCHPVDSNDFVRLYAKAAQGGSSEGGAGDSSGVSPRGD